MKIHVAIVDLKNVVKNIIVFDGLPPNDLLTSILMQYTEPHKLIQYGVESEVLEHKDVIYHTPFVGVSPEYTFTGTDFIPPKPTPDSIWDDIDRIWINPYPVS